MSVMGPGWWEEGEEGRARTWRTLSPLTEALRSAARCLGAGTWGRCGWSYCG